MTKLNHFLLALDLSLYFTCSFLYKGNHRHTHTHTHIHILVIERMDKNSYLNTKQFGY